MTPARKSHHRTHESAQYSSSDVSRLSGLLHKIQWTLNTVQAYDPIDHYHPTTPQLVSGRGEKEPRPRHTRRNCKFRSDVY